MQILGGRCGAVIAPICVLLSAHLLSTLIPVSGFVIPSIPLRAGGKATWAAEGFPTIGATLGGRGVQAARLVAGETNLRMGKSPIASLVDFLFNAGGQPDVGEAEQDGKSSGVVVRTGARRKPIDEAEAKSRSPTKPTVIGGFSVSAEGAAGDYNQYRTLTLKGTGARALSIMTVDVLSALQAEGWPLEEGDLGENVLVSGLPYGFFRLGKQYVVGGATVEVTEAIAPCGNLCRLSWLDKSICPKFIKTLAGRRGWYAKVLSGGHVAAGDKVMSVNYLAG